ncbi:WD40 repeat domain-containing protein [soil metagenome]
MTGWSSALVAALLAGTVTGAPLFAFQDPAITESSGLVDGGEVVYTVNDSGSSAVLYAVEAGSGETTGTTTYARDEVTDVEALAPAPDGDVWVADIGDNLRQRDDIEVFRVAPRGSGSTRFELRYPDGPRDAETLLAHPRTGQLFVVSKTVFGGTVYAAPRRLVPDRTNRLRRVAEVPGFLTDGSFLPDGRHLLLRGYGNAWLLTYPDFGVLGMFDLPEQEQGEGLSVGADGRILLSSEGQRSQVLLVELPTELRTALAPSPAPSSPAASPSEPSRSTKASGEPDSGGAGRWVLLGVIGALAVAGVVSGVRSRRR